MKKEIVVIKNVETIKKLLFRQNELLVNLNKSGKITDSEFIDLFHPLIESVSLCDFLFFYYGGVDKNEE